jgi:hypothetical protein
MKRAFKKLTKQYVLDAFSLLDQYAAETTAVVADASVEHESEEQQPQQPQPQSQQVQKAAAAADGEDWHCVGHIWNDPYVPCPGVGEKCKIKTGIKHNGQRVTVCKECFLSRERQKNKIKRDLKRAKIQNAIKE